ncbi:MAG TPA: hypothetical protein VND94_18885 [Terriglobia bacterium]|nr:hypothetical protein [Terriglobia bacterium]
MTERDPYAPFTVTVDRYAPRIEKETAESITYLIQQAMVKELTKKALKPIVNPSPLALRYDNTAHFEIGARVAKHLLDANYFICRRPVERPHSWPPSGYSELPTVSDEKSSDEGE